MRGHSLSADTKDAIRVCLRRNMDKPDWDGIALAFDTISVIIRNIHKKIIEEIIYKTTIKLLTPSTHYIITTEMEETVAYLVGLVPVIYQDEIA